MDPNGGEMKAEEIVQKLQGRFGASILEAKLESREPWIRIDSKALVDVATFLRDDPELQFDFLRSLAGVDYKGEIELVYLLFSYSKRHAFKLKTRVKTDRAKLATVSEVWPAAEWYEREAYDLVGVEFEGHRDLRRIMLPDDWIGHPLRKDYREQESYRGVSTTREYMTGMPTLPTLPPIPSKETK